MSWLVPRSKLTLDQLRAIEMDIDRHRVVKAAARTGVTNVMLYRAQHLIQKYSIPPERYLIFARSLPEKESLRPALKELSISADSVTTFDGWYEDWYKERVDISREKMLWFARNKLIYALTKEFKKWDMGLSALGLDMNAGDDIAKHKQSIEFDSLIKQLYKEHIEDCISDLHGQLEEWGTLEDYLFTIPTKSKVRYDFILMDEDGLGNAWLYPQLTQIAAHVTLFSNHKGIDNSYQEIGLNRPNMGLSERLGFPMHLANVAKQFVYDEIERPMFLKQCTGIGKNSYQQSLLYLAKDDNNEVNKLIEAVRICIDNSDTIAILLYRIPRIPPYQPLLFQEFPRLNPSIYIDCLIAAGLEVDVVGHDQSLINFNNGRPKFMTYRTAKSLGLTYDAVLMPGLGYYSNSSYRSEYVHEYVHEHLFHGISRANRWVYFSSVEDECPYYDRFEQLEREGHLEIKRHEPEFFQRSTISLPSEEEEEKPEDPKDLF